MTSDQVLTGLAGQRVSRGVPEHLGGDTSPAVSGPDAASRVSAALDGDIV